MGQTDGAITEIIKISQEVIGVMNAGGIIIVTFTSVMDMSELNDYFKLNNRNFMLSIIDKKSFSYNILKTEINNELFGRLPIQNMKIIKMSDDLNKELKINKLNEKTGTTLEIKIDNRKIITNEEIRDMNNETKNKTMNDILGKGIQYLTDHDKDILNKLSK